MFSKFNWLHKFLTKKQQRLKIIKNHLQFFLNAKCPACGYQGEFAWMSPDSGYVSKPGEYWCPACNSALNVAYLQYVNTRLVEKLERFEKKRNLFYAELKKLEWANAYYHYESQMVIGGGCFFCEGNEHKGHDLGCCFDAYFKGQQTELTFDSLDWAKNKKKKVGAMIDKELNKDV